MKLSSKRAKEIIRVRWGDRLVCRVKNGKAICELNNKRFVGTGNTNPEALNNALKFLAQIYGLGNK